MKLKQLLTGLIAGAAAAAMWAIPANADNSETQTDDEGIYYNIEDEGAYYNKADDPEYLKFKNQALEEKRSELFGSTELMDNTPGITLLTVNPTLYHNSRFSDVTKEYGVDISYYQSWNTTIDWAAAKADGVKFAIVRLGFRGYGSAGTLEIDPHFYRNIQAAKDAGLEIGAYFFTQAINTTEAKAEADYCLRLLSGMTLDLPLFIDIEEISYASGRLDRAGLSAYQHTQNVRAFCDTVIAGGFEAGVYASQWWLEYKLYGAELAQDYPVWVACYGSSTSYAGGYDYWQYSSSGYPAGFSTRVDMNVRYKVDHGPSYAPTASISGTSMTWTSVSDADGYVVYSVDSSGNHKALLTVSGTSYTAAAASGTNYYVRAYRKYGGRTYYSGASNYVSAAPDRPYGISATALSSTSIMITWHEISDSSGYMVYQVVDGSYKLVKGTSVNSIIISGLDPNTLYTFSIRAFQGSSSGPIYGEYSDTVTTKTKTGVKYGDVNSDGSVNLKDAVLLGRYVQNPASAEINVEAGDVNVDGAVNYKDVVLIGRHSSGLSVALGAAI